MSNGNPGEVPIIVQGGNSVEVDVPGKFKENGPGGNGGKKFKNSEHNLISLRIDDGDEITLQRTSKIEIKYGTR